MDNETKAYAVAILSVALAPTLTFLGTMWRAKRLGLTREVALEINDRAKFRGSLLKRIDALDELVEKLRKSERGLIELCALQVTQIQRLEGQADWALKENAMNTVKIKSLEDQLALYRAREAPDGL